MKPLLLAGAIALLFGGGAALAKDKARAVHAHHKAHKVVRAARPGMPRDPYADYWKDPGRAAPPFRYFGDVR